MPLQIIETAERAGCTLCTAAAPPSYITAPRSSRLVSMLHSTLQEGQTVLHVAATAGRLDTVEALLDRGCDANVQDFVSKLLL